MNVQITTNGTTTKLQSPYNPNLPAKAKLLGGKFNPSDKSWTFDSRDEQKVHELATAVYGTDGTQVQKLVSVQIKLYQGGSAIWEFGRMIAERSSRDVKVRLGDGVILVSGSFKSSGGSAKYPEIGTDGQVVIVRDVPEQLALDAIAKMPDVYSIVDSEPARISNPLENYSDADLIAELTRRCFSVSK